MMGCKQKNNYTGGDKCSSLLSGGGANHVSSADRKGVPSGDRLGLPKGVRVGL